MWALFVPQFLVNDRDSWEAKGKVLSSHLIVAETLVHVVNFIRLGMLKEKDKPLNVFFFLWNILVSSSFISWAYSNQRSFSKEIPIPDGIYRTSIIFTDLVPCEPTVRALLIRSWLCIAIYIDVMCLSWETCLSTWSPQSIFH